MKIKAHQDILGITSGETADVDGTVGEWAVQNGYASEVGGDENDMHLATSVEAKSDPTLAVNREDPDEFDAAGTEDDASNSEADKAAAAEAPARTTGATEKRDAPKADEAKGTAGDKVEHDGGDAPTAGPAGVEVDDSAKVPAVADARKDSAPADKPSEG